MDIPGLLSNQPQQNQLANLLRGVTGLLDTARPKAQNVLAGLLGGYADKYLGKPLNNLLGISPEGVAETKAMMNSPAVQMGMNLMPLGMIAYHGSPHKFDKFSLDKIGTGEGKTQQGVGGYLSETESIGQKYADRLADMHGKESGYLYKTDLPDEAVSRFANYDKPLSENPQSVQDAISKLMTDDAMHNLRGYYGWDDVKSAPVAAIMGALDVTNGNARNVTAAALKQQGIPGIRYLDGGSRATGSGTSNFVAFDPEMIRILERNGQSTGLTPWKPGEWK